MIGTRLSEILIDLGYDVAHLSRQPADITHYKTFRWDIKKGTLDENAITYADYIINLAGANLTEEKWTEERRQEILDSRVQSTNLLYEKLKTLPHHVKGFISSSAIGIYGNSGDRLVTEESMHGDGFLANVTKQWEQAAWQVHGLGIRTVIFRTGIVLSNKGGALPQMAKPVKMMAGAPLGSGKQYMSWIHIDDLCHLFVEAIENTGFHAVYNAVAPNPVTNEIFTRTLAKVLGKPLVLPNVPAFSLKLVLGQVSEVALGGSRVSANKVLHTGFTFEYTALENALRDCFEII